MYQPNVKICYSATFITVAKSKPKIRVEQWHSREMVSRRFKIQAKSDKLFCLDKNIRLSHH